MRHNDKMADRIPIILAQGCQRGISPLEVGISAPFEKRKQTVFWNPGTVPKEQIVEMSACR